jgi:hypothetical protein
MWDFFYLKAYTGIFVCWIESPPIYCMSLYKSAKKSLTLPIIFADVLNRPQYFVCKKPNYLLQSHMFLTRNISRVFVIILVCGIRYATNKKYTVLVPNRIFFVILSHVLRGMVPVL